jgi:hypothetical protein
LCQAQRSGGTDHATAYNYRIIVHTRPTVSAAQFSQSTCARKTKDADSLLDFTVSFSQKRHPPSPNAVSRWIWSQRRQKITIRARMYAPLEGLRVYPH